MSTVRRMFDRCLTLVVLTTLLSVPGVPQGCGYNVRSCAIVQLRACAQATMVQLSFGENIKRATVFAPSRIQAVVTWETAL